MKKLAVFISHPIQYQAPLYKKLAKEIDLIVYFYSKHGVEKSLDPQFGKVFKWDIPILEGYKFEFLKNHSPKQSFGFFGFVNFGIIKKIYDLRNKNYDAILINSWSYLSDWFVVLSGFLTKTPIFLRVESPLSHEFKKAKWKLFIKKIILGKILFPRIKRFLYIGEENKKFYQFYGVPDEKLIFTPYAVDNERFINQKLKIKYQNEISKIKKELNINDNSIVILFCGKLIEKKRPIDLIKAFQIFTSITRNTRISPNMPNTTSIVEKELSYKLTGIFFEIHNELGRFARERQYADALEVKLQRESIRYKREFAVSVIGRKSNIADFIIEDKVLVELKRKPVNTGDDYRQVMRYIESASLELGLLVNFGLEYLKPKRILNPKLKKSSNHYSVNSDTFVNSGCGINLIFVGDGALRPQLEKYTKDNNLENVHFVGFKNQTELPKYYAIAGIFVLPSGIGETWGLVVNEAMCFELPIIVSDLVGCGADLVKENENGFIYPVGDIEKLAEYLADLIKNKQKRENFGKKSFKIIQNYNYEKDIEGILTALN